MPNLQPNEETCRKHRKNREGGWLHTLLITTFHGKRHSFLEKEYNWSEKNPKPPADKQHYAHQPHTC